MVRKLAGNDANGVANQASAPLTPQQQEFLDANVTHFARTVEQMTGTKGFRSKAEFTLGATPSVRVTVASADDAKVLLQLLSDEDKMDTHGLDGGLEGEGEALQYRAKTGYLRGGLPLTIEVAELPRAKPAVIDSPPRDYGFQDNVDVNGTARMNTQEEFVQANVLALGREINGRAATNGIRAHVSRAGPTQLRVTCDSTETRETLKAMLVGKDFWELSSMKGTVEEIPGGLLRFADSGYLQHGVVIELLSEPPKRQLY